MPRWVQPSVEALARHAGAVLVLLSGACAAPDEVPSMQLDEDWEAWAEADQGVHDWVSSGIAGAADWIDGFLGEERYDEESNRSEVRFRTDGTAAQGEGPAVDPKLRARLALPRTGDRLRLLLTNNADDDQGVDSDPLDDVETTLEESEEQSSAIGLQYVLLDRPDSNVRFDAGARLRDGEPVGRVGLRYRRSVPLDHWLFRVTERVSWLSDDGFDSRTELDWDRVLDEDLFLRVNTTVSWFEELRGAFLAQSFHLTQRLADERVLVYSLIQDYVTHPSTVLSTVRLRLRYRRQLWAHWAFAELSPELRFPREQDYDAQAAILLRFDVFFGARWLDPGPAGG